MKKKLILQDFNGGWKIDGLNNIDISSIIIKKGWNTYKTNGLFSIFVPDFN